MSENSRVEGILQAMIDGDEYADIPQSRVEELLIELKEVIEQGGGGGGTTVVPNPSGEATDDLKKVKIGSVIYKILSSLADLEDDSDHRTVTDAEKATWNNKPDVEANPSGEATDDLNKLKVGSTIFNIPGGGEPVYGEASGAIASFSDGSANPLVKLEADINPIQDLHGYDNPWAAGAGKNKINAPDITLNSAGYIFNGEIDIKAGTYTMSWDSEISSLSFAILDGEGNALVSGGHLTPYTFTLSADAKSARFYSAGAGTFKNIMIESGSTKTSFEPYSNICPIIGRSSVEITACGKNILSNASKESTSSSVARWYYSNGFWLRKNVTYTLSATDESTVYIDNKATGTNIVNGSKYKTYTPSNDILVYFRCYNASGIENTKLMLEVNSQMTAYEDYVDTTETISLGQAVYGGKLNVTTGVLTVGRVEVDMGNISWNHNSINSVYKIISEMKVNSDIIGSELETVAQSTSSDAMPSGTMRVPTDSNTVVVKLDGITVQNAQTMLSGMQLVYELATPITIQLTPTQVSSILGTNNIWADSGDSDVVYIRDKNLFLNQLDARVKALENA